MTIWINAGARDANGERFKTKAALKRALKAAPQSVAFDTTALATTARPDEIVTASDLGNRPRHTEEAWTIVGPDPYTDRRWYATVKVNRLKNLVVS